MSETQPIAFLNARLIDAAGERMGGVLIEQGRIRAAGPEVTRAQLPAGAEVIDAGGLIVAPGLVDIGAHCGEPGGEHRETLRTASEAAAAGGITTIACRPDTAPATDDPAIIDFIKRRARDKAIVNILPMASITKGLAGREMTEFGLLLEAGAIAFSDGKHSIRNAQVLRRALSYARDIGALIMHHAEDADLVGSGVMNEGEFATRLGLPGIPRAAEAIMLERDLRLVRMSGARYHVPLISCLDSLDLIQGAKADGLPVTCGVSINSLTLNEKDIGDYRTFCKLAPPLRSEEERIALAQAVASGLIDIVISDHDPQDVETKRQPFQEAANGAVGLETMLSAGLRLVHAGLLTLPGLFGAMSANPSRLLGLEAGRLSAGAPADLMLLDPDEPYVLSKEKLHSRAKNSPFDEARMEGVVKLTLVNGAVVHRASLS